MCSEKEEIDVLHDQQKKIIFKSVIQNEVKLTKTITANDIISLQ